MHLRAETSTAFIKYVSASLSECVCIYMCVYKKTEKMKLHSQTMAGQGEPCVLSLFVEDLRGDETTLGTTVEKTL